MIYVALNIFAHLPLIWIGVKLNTFTGKYARTRMVLWALSYLIFTTLSSAFMYYTDPNQPKTPFFLNF